MTYPTLSTLGAQEALKAFQAGDDIEEVVGAWEESSEGAEFDPATSVDLANLLWEMAGQKGVNGYKFERQAAAIVHERLNLDPKVAGDPGFWRWLTFSADGSYAELVDWRYPTTESGHAREVYFGFGQMKNGMLNYLWLCAEAVVDQTREDPYELSRRGDVDIWQSHIVRVDFGSVPQLARSFISFAFPSENDQSVSRDDYRKLAKEITRRNASMAFEVLDDSDCLELLQQIWNERDVWEFEVGLV